MHGISSPLAILHLRKIALNFHADIIHTHLTRAAYIGHLTGRLSSIPVVSSVHVLHRNPAYRYLPNYDRSVVAVSEYLRMGLIANGVSPDRVQTVYNGTDFTDQMITPGGISVHAELCVPGDAILVGLFGQINAFKGSRVLVEAAEKTLKKYPNTYFVFVGSVNPHYQQELYAIAEAGGYSERLRFTGARTDIQRLMGEMDIVTLPSKYEACSMAIIEAMAVGKPVIATRAGGNPELVQHGETGLLIDRNPEALADAIISMLADSASRSRMGEAGHQVARERFSSAMMAKRMEELYLRIVSSPQSPVAV